MISFIEKSWQFGTIISNFFNIEWSDNFNVSFYWISCICTLVPFIFSLKILSIIWLTCVLVHLIIQSINKSRFYGEIQQLDILFLLHEQKYHSCGFVNPAENSIFTIKFLDHTASEYRPATASTALSSVQDCWALIFTTSQYKTRGFPLFVQVSRSGYLPWILKRGGLQTSG